MTKNHHPTKCGLEGKLYNESDFVTPISDSLKRLLHSCFSARLEFDPSLFSADDDSMCFVGDPFSGKRRRAPQQKGLQSLFACCPNQSCPSRSTAAAQTIQTEEYEDGCVCSECGAVLASRLQLKASWEEKESASTISVNSGGNTFGRPGKFAGAQKAVDSEAHQHLLKAGIVMDKSNQMRLVRILNRLNNLYVDIGPVDLDLQHQINGFCEQAWRSCVDHACKCENPKRCRVRLQDRSTAIIALAVAETLLARAAGQDREIDSSSVETHMSRTSAAEVLCRLKATPEYGNCTCATQLAATRCIVKILTSPSFDHNLSCGSKDGPVRLVRSGRNKQTGSSERIGAVSEADAQDFGRAMARIESWEDPTSQTHKLLQDTKDLKDSVMRVYLAHGAGTLSRSLRAVALDCVQDVQFFQACTELSARRSYSWSCMALIILCAVQIRHSERQRAKTSGVTVPEFVSKPRVDATIAARLGITAREVSSEAETLAPLISVTTLEREDRCRTERTHTSELDLLAAF